MRGQPFGDAMQMKAMLALAPNDGTIVAGDFTVRAAGMERHPANSTIVVVRVPTPNADGVPLLDADLQAGSLWPLVISVGHFCRGICVRGGLARFRTSRRSHFFGAAKRLITFGVSAIL